MPKINIGTFNLNKDEEKFPQRIIDLSSIVCRNNFDILCLQEDYNSLKFSSGKFLNVELDYNYNTLKTREKFRNGILSSSNLTILSKYKTKELENIYFNKNEKKQRACQLIEIDIKGYIFLIANTHLCHLSSENRIEQIKVILKAIDKYSFDVCLLCGDLNSLKDSKEIQEIKNSDFKDVNKEFTHEDKLTLDYIFYKSNKIDLTVESKILFRGFSDHFCLVNKINF